MSIFAAYRIVAMFVAVTIMDLSLLHIKLMPMRLWSMEMMTLISHIMIFALEVDGLSVRLDILT
jgi:hypothetical protein